MDGAQIGLPQPLHAYKSHHAACDSRYEVTPATNDILLTSAPVHGMHVAVESGGHPLMGYLDVKKKEENKKFFFKSRYFQSILGTLILFWSRNLNIITHIFMLSGPFIHPATHNVCLKMQQIL